MALEFAEFKFSLRNGSMNNYCFRWQRRVTMPEHACMALFPNIQEKKKKIGGKVFTDSVLKET